MKKLIFLCANITMILVFLCFAIYGIVEGKYAEVISLLSSSMLVIYSAYNIYSDME